MKTKQEVLAALNAAGLSAVVQDLEPLIWSSIRVITQQAETQAAILGTSRLGGLPDLPANMLWPRWKDKAMSFVAQFNLAEISKFDEERALPQSGLLFFFYDANQQDFGSEPVNPGQWKVLYTKGEQNTLRRLAAPGNLPPDRLFKSCSVEFSSEVTLPLDVSAFGLSWDKPTLDRYSDFMASFPTAQDRHSTQHRLLGHPDQIQDDMHLQVALEATGRKPEQGSPADRQDALDWRLLFQVDSDDKAVMEWANTGMLYYWIKAGALHAQDFDNVWLEMQSE